MLWLFRFSFSASKSSHLLLRVGGAIGVALLIAGGSFFSGTHPAFASGCPNIAPAYFVHTATSANTHGKYTDLDEPTSRFMGCGFAAVFVTANWNPGGVYTGFDNHPVGVWFDPIGEWAVTNEDGAPMPVGASFNVYMVSPWAGSPSASTIFLQTATTGKYITYLNDPTLNGHPSAQLMVTQDYNYGASTTVISNPHEIGIWYDPFVGQWTIYNEDKSPIPNGAVFNVMVVKPSAPFPNAFTQVATSSNTSGDSTCINNILSNQNLNAFIFTTHVYNGYFTDVSAVWYNTNLSEWCIFDGSYNNMPLGATFSVALP